MQISKILSGSFLIFAAFCGNSIEATSVNNGKSISCTDAEITSVRIYGCESEPCRIVKGGEHLPVEIDFSFESPTWADQINFSVSLRNLGDVWLHGIYLAQDSVHCGELLPGASCPAQSGNKYTLKSNVYLSPESLDTLSSEATGQGTTILSLSPTAGQNDYSTCSFSVQFDIVEPLENQ